MKKLLLLLLAICVCTSNAQLGVPCGRRESITPGWVVQNVDPVANLDIFSVWANTEFEGSGVLTNDERGVQSSELIVVDIEETTLLGGLIVSWTEDGSFVYRPPRGHRDVIDTVAYTASNGEREVVGTIRFVIQPQGVWWVDNTLSAAGGGDGTSWNPYNRISMINDPYSWTSDGGAADPSTGSDEGDYIRVLFGAAVYGDENVVLKRDQRLLGSGVEFDIGVERVDDPSDFGQASMEHNNGTAIVLAENVRVEGLIVLGASCGVPSLPVDESCVAISGTGLSEPSEFHVLSIVGESGYGVRLVNSSGSWSMPLTVRISEIGAYSIAILGGDLSLRIDASLLSTTSRTYTFGLLQVVDHRDGDIVIGDGVNWAARNVLLSVFDFENMIGSSVSVLASPTTAMEFCNVLSDVYPQSARGITISGTQEETAYTFDGVSAWSMVGCGNSTFDDTFVEAGIYVNGNDDAPDRRRGAVTAYSRWSSVIIQFRPTLQFAGIEYAIYMEMSPASPQSNSSASFQSLVTSVGGAVVFRNLDAWRVTFDRVLSVADTATTNDGDFDRQTMVADVAILSARRSLFQFDSVLSSNARWRGFYIDDTVDTEVRVDDAISVNGYNVARNNGSSISGVHLSDLVGTQVFFDGTLSIVGIASHFDGSHGLSLERVANGSSLVVTGTATVSLAHDCIAIDALERSTVAFLSAVAVSQCGSANQFGHGVRLESTRNFATVTFSSTLSATDVFGYGVLASANSELTTLAFNGAINVERVSQVTGSTDGACIAFPDLIFTSLSISVPITIDTCYQYGLYFEANDALSLDSLTPSFASLSVANVHSDEGEAIGVALRWDDDGIGASLTPLLLAIDGVTSSAGDAFGVLLEATADLSDELGFFVTGSGSISGVSTTDGSSRATGLFVRTDANVNVYQVTLFSVTISDIGASDDAKGVHFFTEGGSVTDHGLTLRDVSVRTVVSSSGSAYGINVEIATGVTVGSEEITVQGALTITDVRATSTAAGFSYTKDTPVTGAASFLDSAGRWNVSRVTGDGAFGVSLDTRAFNDGGDSVNIPELFVTDVHGTTSERGFIANQMSGAFTVSIGSLQVTDMPVASGEDSAAVEFRYNGNGPTVGITSVDISSVDAGFLFSRNGGGVSGLTVTVDAATINSAMAAVTISQSMSGTFTFTDVETFTSASDVVVIAGVSDSNGADLHLALANAQSTAVLNCGDPTCISYAGSGSLSVESLQGSGNVTATFNCGGNEELTLTNITFEGVQVDYNVAPGNSSGVIVPVLGHVSGIEVTDVRFGFETREGTGNATHCIETPNSIWLTLDPFCDNDSNAGYTFDSDARPVPAPICIAPQNTTVDFPSNYDSFDNAGAFNIDSEILILINQDACV
jgi:hypothetical protein